MAKVDCVICLVHQLRKRLTAEHILPTYSEVNNMAFLEALNSNLHRAVDVLTRVNPNSGTERLLAQPLPAVDFSPVNEPGSRQPLMTNAWYTLVDSARTPRGFMFNCICGQSNPYLHGAYDLRRELENDHFCRAHCVRVDVTGTDDMGKPIRTVAVEKDKDNNPTPQGKIHNLRHLLHKNGEGMDERNRNMVYSTLPTWRLGPAATAAPPFIPVGDMGGNMPGDSFDYVKWNGQGGDKGPPGSDGRWI